MRDLDCNSFHSYPHHHLAVSGHLYSRQVYLQKTQVDVHRIGDWVGPRASLDFLENKSFLPHRTTHRVCPVLQLIFLSLQIFCYGGLRIRARMETFITQSHSLATHLCSCVIKLQLCGKKTASVV